jgi:DNA-binding transcriptional LysR family regulator
MKLEQLRYFYEAARHQHVGRAGKSLHISPSAVSSAITLLEEELQVVLFDRVGKRVQLSEAGQRLKIRTEALFDFVEEIRSDFIPGQDKGFIGDFRVGGSHFLATNYLSLAWDKFQKNNPGLVGELIPGRTADILSSILRGTLDVGVCFSPLKHPELQFHELHKGQLVLLVRKGHPALKKITKANPDISILSNFPAIVHKSTPGVDICEEHSEFAKHGIKCKVANYFESDELAVNTILRSESWSLLPDVVLKKYQTSLAAIPLPKNWTAPYEISAVFRKSRLNSPIVKTFLKTLDGLASKD